MSRELLKRALDALDEGLIKTEAISLSEEIETYLAQPDKPVAWMIENHPTESTFANFKNFNSHFEHIGCKVTPLYTTPPDQSARVAELEQRIKELETEAFCDDEENQFLEIEVYKLEQQLEALKAKREPLTWDELQRLSDECGIEWSSDAINFARAIEAAHGIGGE